MLDCVCVCVKSMHTNACMCFLIGLTSGDKIKSIALKELSFKDERVTCSLKAYVFSTLHRLNPKKSLLRNVALHPLDIWISRGGVTHTHTHTSCASFTHFTPSQGQVRFLKSEKKARFSGRLNSEEKKKKKISPFFFICSFFPQKDSSSITFSSSVVVEIYLISSTSVYNCT